MKIISRGDFLGGTATFLAGAYIVLVNPAILSEAGASFSGILTATVLVTVLSTLAMGIFAKVPILVAPGMGLNAFFTYTAVLGMGLSYSQALGAVFWSGLLFLGLSIFGIREKVVNAIPESLKTALAGGIGLFIAFIGLQNAGLVIKNPATIVGIGAIKSPEVISFAFGLITTAWLHSKKIMGAILWGILVSSILYYLMAGAPNLPESWFSTPDFSLFGSLNLKDAFIPEVIFVFAFTDLFDSISTLVGLSQKTEFPKSFMRKALLVDAGSTLFSGIAGSSPGTAYIESAVGMESGGKSGKASIVTALWFLPCLFLAPALSLIPASATAVALVLVGVFIIKSVGNIPWDNLEESLPAFLILILTPLTYSLTIGLISGFLSFTLFKILNGKIKEISTPLWLISLSSLVLLYFNF